MNAFDDVKVFCATVPSRRQSLGEEVARWLEDAHQQPNFQVLDIVVRQSSDAAFHCLSIVIFFSRAQVPSGVRMPASTPARNVASATKKGRQPKAVAQGAPPKEPHP